MGWRARRLEPFQVLPLWEGGTFDETYNTKRRAVNFTAPAGTRRVLLEAVITGSCLVAQSCNSTSCLALIAMLEGCCHRSVS